MTRTPTIVLSLGLAGALLACEVGMDLGAIPIEDAPTAIRGHLVADGETVRARCLVADPVVANLGVVPAGSLEQLPIDITNTCRTDELLRDVRLLSAASGFALFEEGTLAEDGGQGLMPVATGHAPWRPVYLHPGEVLRLVARYEAPDDGPATASLQATGSDRQRRQIAKVVANHEGPCLEVPRSPVRFGCEAVSDAPPRARLVQLPQCGADPVDVVSVTLGEGSSAAFHVAAVAPRRLLPGGALDIEVRYDPTTIFETDAKGRPIIETARVEVRVEGRADPFVAHVSGFGGPDPCLALEVEVAWFTPGARRPKEEGGDLDLHLLHRNLAARGWCDRPFDVFWANRGPDWGIPGDPYDNPRLLQDDTDGRGPEQIHLEVADDVPYTVGVHYFDDYEWGPSHAQIKVWTWGRLVYESFDDVQLLRGDIWEAVTIDGGTGLPVQAHDGLPPRPLESVCPEK